MISKKKLRKAADMIAIAHREKDINYWGFNHSGLIRLGVMNNRKNSNIKKKI